MAGLLDEYFNPATFKAPAAKGLLEMLTQMFPLSTETQGMGLSDMMKAPGMGPSQGFAIPGPPPPDAHLPMPPNRAPIDALPVPPPPGAGPRSFDNAYFDPATYQGVGANDQLPPAMAQMAGATPGPAPAGWPSLYFPPDARAEAPGAAASQPPASQLPAPPTQPEGPGMLERVGRHILQTLHDNSNSMIAGGGAMISGGLGHGLSAMASAAPLDIAARRERQGNAAIQATYEAVLRQQLSRGVPMADAQATALGASQNAELLKTVVGPQYQHVEVKDALGNSRIGAFDPRTGSVTYPGQSGAGGGISGAPPAGLQGPELGEWFKQNDPATYAAIESIYRGDVNAGGRNLQKYLPYAALVHPDLHQFDYATRAKTRAFYTSGAGGLESKAANTAIEHAEQLSKIDEKLGGFDIGGHYANQVIQGAKGLYDSKFQDARREWDAKSETLATEVAKAISGGVPHVADKEHWREVFAAASTPTERKAAIRSVMEIIQGRQTAAEQNYAQGMGPAREGFAFISPENQQRYERLLNYGHEAPARSSSSSAAPAPPAPPAAPKKGDTVKGSIGGKPVTIEFDGTTWVPK